MQDKGPSENHSSGLALSELFYQRELKPLLDASFPNLEYSAGLVGWGSEVLGYDDRTSEDHHWGPRAMIFVHDEDLSNAAPIIKALFASRLPYEFMDTRRILVLRNPTACGMPCEFRSAP
jgi:hypothetical protein